MKCLACPCLIIKSRGLCNKCAAKTHHLVKVGLTTYKQLERAGKVLKPGKRKCVLKAVG